MMKIINRIKWFFRLVWRDFYGRISIKTAWTVGKILKNL